MNTVTTIDFHGQSILTINQDNIIYTAIKPICENIGLAWHGQYERIKRDEVLKSTVRVIRMVADDNKIRQLVCLPLQYLNGWLFGVDVKRVKPEIQDTLIMYKKECYQVLHDYWHKGVAVNPRPTTKSERTPLKNAVNMLIGKTNLNYSEAYRMVHQYMGVKHIDEIAKEDLPQAVEYVHSLIIKAGHNPTNLSDVQRKAVTDLIVDLWEASTLTAPMLLKTIELYREDSLPYYITVYRNVHRSAIKVVNEFRLKGSRGVPLISNNTITTPSGVRMSVGELI